MRLSWHEFCASDGQFTLTKWKVSLDKGRDETRRIVFKNIVVLIIQEFDRFHQGQATQHVYKIVLTSYHIIIQNYRNRISFTKPSIWFDFALAVLLFIIVPRMLIEWSIDRVAVVVVLLWQAEVTHRSSQSVFCANHKVRHAFYSWHLAFCLNFTPPPHPFQIYEIE